MSTTQNTATMKLTKQYPGQYTTEGIYNGQPYTLEFSSGEYGWEYELRIDGLHRGGDCPGLGCRLKDLKQMFKDHGVAVFIN